MVRVEVKLCEKEEIMEVPAGTSVRNLLQQLEPRWRDNAIVIIDGKVAKGEELLYPSERILIFPLLAGG